MCERTSEFLQFVSQAKHVNNSDPYHKSNKAAEAPITKTAFNEAAGEIARGVYKTSAILTKLTNLVRRQGLFDDPTEEINTLICRIKQDLDELNAKCETAQKYVDGKKSMFGEVDQSAAHNVKVVSHLKTDLMNTTKDFKTVLEMRSSKMKEQDVRKVELIGKGKLSPLHSLEVARNNPPLQSSSSNGDGIAAMGNRKFSGPNSQSSNKLPSPYMHPYGGYSQPYGVGNGDNKRFNNQLEMQSEQQQQLLLDPIGNNQYFDARERAVTEVERTIGELGQLFTRLATMIEQQQEMIERVDEDVESAVTNANNARDQLMQAYQTVSSNRAMYMKIAAILGVFALFFVLFLM